MYVLSYSNDVGGNDIPYSDLLDDSSRSFILNVVPEDVVAVWKIKEKKYEYDWEYDYKTKTLTRSNPTLIQ